MEPRLKVYFDTEFTGLHRNTTLISIGLISETGSTFYAEFMDYDKSQVDDWLQKHVIDNLLFQNESKKVLWNREDEFGEHSHIHMKGSSAEIKEFLERWFQFNLEIVNKRELYNEEITKVQIYSDCYAYDWVLFNELICKNGLALNLPDYLYYIPVDLSTYLQMRKIDPDINREELIHKLLPDYDLEDNILSQEPFRSATCNDRSECKENAKHNSLWDAIVCKLLFEKLNIMSDEEIALYLYTKNHRIYPQAVVQKAVNTYMVDKLIPSGSFMGEQDHPED